MSTTGGDTMQATTETLTITRHHVALETARAVVAAAEVKARELGLAAAIAVVDAEGTLKAFARMDGAALLPVRIAQQKAWTAISFGMGTHEWWDMVREDPPLLHGITHQQDVVVFGGGLPIRDGEEVIGGIGVSGGHYTQDQEIAQAGLDVLSQGAK
jgi:uncharacterized protein GlcG (DUF336 family)